MVSANAQTALRAAYQHLEEAAASIEEVSRVTYFPGQPPSQINTRGVAVHLDAAIQELRRALQAGAPPALGQVVSTLVQARDALLQVAWGLRGLGLVPSLPMAMSPFAAQMGPNMGPGPVTSMMPQGVSFRTGLAPQTQFTQTLGPQLQMVKMAIQQAKNIVERFANAPNLTETAGIGLFDLPTPQSARQWVNSSEFFAGCFFVALYLGKERVGRYTPLAAASALFWPRASAAYQALRLMFATGRA